MRIIKFFSLISLMIILLLLSSPSAKCQIPIDSPDLSGIMLQRLNKLNLLVDGVETKPDNMPSILTSGRTVITLPALQNLIHFQSEWGPEGELVLIGEENRIQLFAGQNEMLVNSLPQALEIAPFTSDDGSLLLPLRSVGEALGYTVTYDEASGSILLNSPGYQPLPPAVVIPDRLPVIIDYNSLPTWGCILSIPDLVDLWKEEQIVTGYFTSLVNSPPGRTTNIALSSGKINGMVLQPGEVFSFNQIVGPRTAQSGYKNAKIFVGQKVVTGIGGGICQTSSTIYNLALEAGMQILERYPHSQQVVYAPPKRDATVSWGSADLKFRNTKEFPVKILCNIDNGYVFAVMVRAGSPDSALTVPSIISTEGIE